MKTKNLLIGILVLFVILGIWYATAYNSIVKKSESVSAQWSQVETQYQRRIDLIPNLVNVAQGYMQFEKDLLINITALRSQWMNAKTDTEKIGAASGLDSAVSRLLVVYESYPDLKSTQQVSSLMDELAGTENRISVERKRYNDAVRDYNAAIKVFPTNVVAGTSGFLEKKYYESIQGADKAPDVKIY